VSEPSKGKRRRGSQQQRSAKRSGKPSQPVGGSSVTSNIPGLPWLVGGVIVLLVLVGGFIVLQPRDGGTAASPSAAPSAAASAGTSAAAGSCPSSQPPALPAGQTRTVTLDTTKGAIVIKVEADLSPIAAGNFVALAGCGFYDGTVFHRTPTLQDGTPFVIQGGDPEGSGMGGPGYTIQDEPVTTPYKRGTVAMARSSAPNSVGSQFFIVLDDKDGAILGSANTYQIIGNVTSGMDVADAIYVASGGVELPPNPIPITTATVANP
jgi:cyclophilin family peptidyl-prolyl cis-trans isomerase